MRMFCIPLAVLVLATLASSQSAGNDFNTLHVEQNVDTELKFPEELHLKFSYYGNDVVLKLSRDHQTTSELSAAIFKTSRVLPTGLFSGDKAEDFSAYTSDTAMIVAHRDNLTLPSKVYGKFMLDGEPMVMASEGGSPYLHRITREAETSQKDIGSIRKKRAEKTLTELSDDTDVIELFVFTDYSFYEFWSNHVMLTASDDDIDPEIADWLQSYTRDVDTLFHKVNAYSSLDIRVYMQDYQVAMKPRHSPWLDGAVNEENDELNVDLAMENMESYYQTLVDRFSYPEPDHILILSRYDFDTGDQFANLNSLCRNAPKRAISYVNPMYFIKPAAQAIAKSMGVRMDTPPDSPCDENDQYVMSPIYSPVTSSTKDHPWKFSLCSIYDMHDFIKNGKSSCLEKRDQRFDFDDFMTIPPFGRKYSPTQQCQANFGSSSSFCNTATGNSDSSQCSNDGDGCKVGADCVPHQMGDQTPCNGEDACRFGICTRSLTPTNDNDKHHKTSTYLPSSSIGSFSMSLIASTPSKQSTTAGIGSSTTTGTTTDQDRQSTTTSGGSTTTDQDRQSTTTSGGSTTTDQDRQSTTTSGGSTTTDQDRQSTTTSGGSTTTDQDRQSSTSTLSTTTAGTTTDKTTEELTCIIDWGFEDVTLPGCGCCGGCGCDDTCDSCSDGFGRPASIDQGVCNITDGCCPGVIRISKSFVPDNCGITIVPNDQRLVIEKQGWEVSETVAKIVASPEGSGWHVHFK